jgi:hypothetical protein
MLPSFMFFPHFVMFACKIMQGFYIILILILVIIIIIIIIMIIIIIIIIIED